MKEYTRMQNNKGFDIPRHIRKHFLLDNNIAKWIINKNEAKVYLSFLKTEEELVDYENDEEIVFFRKVHGNHSITLPKKVFYFLRCENYYYIKWNINQNKIIIECFKKPHISDISGIFPSKEDDFYA